MLFIEFVSMLVGPGDNFGDEKFMSDLFNETCSRCLDCLLSVIEYLLIPDYVILKMPHRFCSIQGKTYLINMENFCMKNYEFHSIYTDFPIGKEFNCLHSNPSHIFHDNILCMYNFLN